MNLRDYAEKSVLCWLATADADGFPNVSPKEMFTMPSDDLLLIANIASPTSARNIRANPNVCVSFIDVFEERGFKVKAQAAVIESADAQWATYHPILHAMTGGRLNIRNIFALTVQSVSKIVSPSYAFYADTTTVEQQMQNALQLYGVTKQHP